MVRTLVRHRETLVRGASQSTQHMQKAMDQMNVRLHHAVTDITGLSGLRIIDAILAGERDPARLADLAHKRIKASRETLMAALEGNWREELLLTLRQARETYAHYQRLIGECDQQINALIRAFERDLAGPQEPGSDVEAGSAKPSSRRGRLAPHPTEGLVGHRPDAHSRRGGEDRLGTVRGKSGRICPAFRVRRTSPPGWVCVPRTRSAAARS